MTGAMPVTPGCHPPVVSLLTVAKEQRREWEGKLLAVGAVGCRLKRGNWWKHCPRPAWTRSKRCFPTTAPCSVHPRLHRVQGAGALC